jgi:hypothetical protein
MKHLGLSLSALFKAKSIWDDINEKDKASFGWFEKDILVKG